LVGALHRPRVRPKRDAIVQRQSAKLKRGWPDVDIDRVMAGGRPTKTLLERVVENSYRPTRYGELLAGEILPQDPPRGFRNARQRRAWRLLRRAQQNWQDNARSGRRNDREWSEELARMFAELVRWFHGASKPTWID
jgi:hypothetical protein